MPGILPEIAKTLWKTALRSRFVCPRACYALLGFALCRCMERIAYPTDVSDQEWAFVAPYLTLMTEEAPQREHSLREVFNGLRWLIRSGGAWRLMPHDLPPWAAVYQQTKRWLKAGVFEAIVDDRKSLIESGTRAKRTANCCDY